MESIKGLSTYHGVCANYEVTVGFRFESELAPYIVLEVDYLDGTDFEIYFPDINALRECRDAMTAFIDALTGKAIPSVTRGAEPRKADAQAAEPEEQYGSTDSSTSNTDKP